MKWTDPRIIIVIVAIAYFIFDREMNRVKEYDTTEQRVRLEQGKLKYQQETQEQEQKIHLYEITLDHKTDAVDDMSNDNIDSLWSAIHG